MSLGTPIDHFQLLEVKQQRKRADEDSKLLANRIALLRQEEAKALKKIEEVRKQASKIVEARARNLERQRKKEEERKAKEEEEKTRTMQLRMQKEQNKVIKQQAKQMLYEKARADANALKQAKWENIARMNNTKEETLTQKITMKQQIRETKIEGIERRKREEEIRKQRLKQEIERRYAEEQKMREDREAEVARLEKEELELISRLQNTQMMQRTAFEDLEMALSGQIDLKLDNTQTGGKLQVKL